MLWLHLNRNVNGFKHLGQSVWWFGVQKVNFSSEVFWRNLWNKVILDDLYATTDTSTCLKQRNPKKIQNWKIWRFWKKTSPGVAYKCLIKQGQSRTICFMFQFSKFWIDSSHKVSFEYICLVKRCKMFYRSHPHRNICIE